MPRGKFNIPDAVEDASNAAPKNLVSSVTIAGPKGEDIERVDRQRHRHEAIRRILDRRSRAPVRSDSEIAAARREGRP